MISIITTLKNRAELLYSNLRRLILDRPVYAPFGELEINIGDGGSNDDLDRWLSKLPYVGYGNKNMRIRKWTILRDKSKYNHPFNCPAEELNILVKLSSGKIILKTDPEMYLLDIDFIKKAYELLLTGHYIVMPFPIHTYEFEYKKVYKGPGEWESHVFDDPETMRRKISNNLYTTHITKENCQTRNVYYMAMFKKQDYIDLGGVDERFIDNGIGSEDDHFLSMWRKKYGEDTTRTLTDYGAAHMWHGEWGKGVPVQFMPWVRKNEILRKQLEDSYPNQNREWGTLYPHLICTEWVSGKGFTFKDKPLHEVIT